MKQVVNPSGRIFNQLVHLVLYTSSGHYSDLVTCMLQDSPKLRGAYCIWGLRRFWRF